MSSYKSLLLPLVLLVNTVLGQKGDQSCFTTGDLITAKRSLCEGNKFEIYNVTISTLFHLRKQRHPLFKGEELEICMSGKATGISEPVRGLLNVVHGQLDLLLKIDTPFCDIKVDACENITPPCGPEIALEPNQEFCMCTKVQVPADIPGFINLDVNTFWRLVAVDRARADSKQCETESDAQKLAARGAQTLVCMEIPAMLRNKRPPGQDKASIIQRIRG